MACIYEAPSKQPTNLHRLVPFLFGDWEAYRPEILGRMPQVLRDQQLCLKKETWKIDGCATDEKVAGYELGWMKLKKFGLLRLHNLVVRGRALMIGESVLAILAMVTMSRKL
jgi:hypothetical protein